MLKINRVLLWIGILGVLTTLSITTFGQTRPGKQTLVIADKLVDCSKGAGKGQCMLVSWDGKTWQYFYDQIQGFNFKDNYTQKIEVNVTPRPNPPADASSWNYKYIKTLNSRRTNGQSARQALASLNSGGDTSATATPLVGTNWTLEQLNGKTLINPGPTLVFDGQTKRFSTKICNNINGTYMLGSGNKLSFGPAASTRMACSGPEGKMENEFLKTLPKVTSYQITGNQLKLISGSRVVMSFMANGATMSNSDSTIEGKRWYLSDIYGIIIKAENTIPYMFLDPATNTISGFSGCNNFTGKYSLNNGTLLVQNLVSTQKACVDQHLTSVEQAMMSLLQGNNQYSISSGYLTLKQDGREVMRFVSRER